MPLYVGAQNTSTQPGSKWEVLGTTDFETSNGSYSENTGWTTDYQLVRCAFSYLGRSSTGSNTYASLSCRFYLADAYSGNGSLSTGNNYQHSNRYRDAASSDINTQADQGSEWKFFNGNSALYWDGEITFRIGTDATNRNTYKHATARIEMHDTSSISIGDDYAEDVTSSSKVIVGAKIYEHGGNNFIQGRVTWYGLKYA